MKKEDLNEAIKYIILKYALHVSNRDGVLLFEFNNVEYDFKSFVAAIKDDTIIGVRSIIYNGVNLNEDGRKEFYEFLKSLSNAKEC